jgi:hypothetical protein
VSERIQTNQAKDILGVSKRSVQSFAAQGILPSAAQIGRAWTFDKAALRRFVAECEEAARQRSNRHIIVTPTPKKAVNQASSYGIQGDYERALGLKVDHGRGEQNRNPHSSRSKPKKGGD